MISVKEYLKNKALLEATYTPYQIKCTIVDKLIDMMRISDDELWIIDYAQLQPVKDSMFVSQITNLDMVTENEDGLLGYDILKRERQWDYLIASIKDEYDAFNDILELKLKTIKEHNSEARIMNEVCIKILDSFATVSQILENVDISKILEKISE